MNILRNAVHLFGHAGKDTELTILESGKKVAKVTIATNEVYKGQAGRKFTSVNQEGERVWR